MRKSGKMKHLEELLKRRYHGRILASFFTVVMFLNISPLVTWAGPEGAQVINGDVSIQQSANNTTIMASDKAIINYSSFDIAQSETVQFIQPSNSASVLNRILSASPTNIDGTLLANGRVFFVNPAGIYIGAGAIINVNQLVASGLNITDSDFINGQYNFAGGNGFVINNGDISAEEVYLIGKQVTNSGNINCPTGYVVMASGDRVFLGELGSEIVLEIDESSLSESTDAADSEAGILNEGIIEAAGGKIALAAAGDIYSQAILNVGTISASVETGNAGNVKLTAAEGTVINSGSIEATSSSGTGGIVQILGDRIGLFNAAEIDVSGSDGGGTVLVGGDYQGKGEVPTASQTFIGPDSSIIADATESGDGGKVIVWADDFTRYYGHISAQGGAQSGDGGFAEVSGNQRLRFQGTANLSSEVGDPGVILLDPRNIQIVDGGAVSDLVGTNNSDGNANIYAWNESDNGTGADGDDDIDASVIEGLLNGGSSVTLQAHHDIWIEESITTSAVAVGDLTIQAGDDVYISQAIDLSIGTNRALSVIASNVGGGDQGGAAFNGDGQFTGTGDISVTATLTTTGSGAITISTDDGTVDLANVTAGGDLQVTGANIDLNGTTYMSTGDDVTFSGAVDLDAGATTTVTAGGGVGDTITFTGTVDDAGNDTGLDLVAGLGEVVMQGDVGITAAEQLGSFTVTSAGQVDLDDVEAEGAIDVTGTDINLNSQTYTSNTEDVRFNGAVDLDAGAVTTTVTAGSGTGDDITFTSTVDDSTSDTTLVLVAGAGGDINFNGLVGGVVTLGDVTINSAHGVFLNDAFNANNISITAANTAAHNMTATGDLTLNSMTTVADGSTLTAGGDLNVGANMTSNGALTLIATGGSISGSGTIQATDGAGTDLTLRQGSSLDLANLTLGNQSNTDLMVESYTGGITIDKTNPANAADQWKSITGTAENNIVLSGSGDIKIGGNMTSASGGVSIVSDNGGIYDKDSYDYNTNMGTALDNVAITGSPTPGAGVDLPNGIGKAAIVIRSPKQDLTLGANATLTANGIYSTAVDDRTGVWFDASGPDAGDPIDVAIYLGTYEPGPTDAPVEPYHDVAIDSKISIADYGTMVIDADENVTFGDAFGSGSPPPDQTTRLEVVSRISQTLEEVIGPPERLPYARNPVLIGTRFLGTYVLRGDTLLAEILALIEAVPWPVSRPLELEVGGEVEGPDTEALDKLLNELGIGVQPYVTEAYAASLSTDLRLFSAAEKLQQLIPILEDADGIRIAGLREAAAQFFPTLDALSEQQVSSFTEALVRHKGDGTDYDAAGQCIFALTEYVTILGNDIGWPADKSIRFVMSRYVPRLTEGDEIRIAVIQMQLQKAFGI